MRSALLIGLLELWALGAGVAAQELVGPPPPKLIHDERLESRLVELAQHISAMRALGVQGDSGTVSIILERRHERFVASLGAQVEARSSRLVRVRLPVEKLFALTEVLPTDAYVRLPLRPWGAAIAGLEVTGVNEWHAHGVRGQGVRVAVIDIGFTGLSEALASGRIANVVFQKDYTRLGMEGGDESHGTKVTEILHAMAPDAELLLYRIADEVDLENAVEDALKRRVRIINHSVGWVNTDFGDGTGIIAQIAQSAVQRGVVWVNAAGNAAQRHWAGPWQDFDGDGWLNLDAHRERFTLAHVEAGDTIEVFLTWDEWPRSRTDYDLYLLYDFNGDGQLDPDAETVASSTNRQSGRQPPTESIEYLALFPGEYFLAVAGPSGAAGRTLKIFSFNHDLTPAVAAGSLLAPAPAPDVIAVGAIDFTGYTQGTIEPFSSQGPTSDGRIKPDLVAPDGLQTSTGRFFGTSASSPVVAGAAALLLSREPTLSPAQLRARLLAHTLDVGPAGLDSVFGAGRLLLRLDDQWPIPEISLRPGDLTGDGRLDKADLKLLRDYLRGQATLTPAQAAAADLVAPCGPPHDRSTITQDDYRALRRAARGRPVTFECPSQAGALTPLAQQLTPTMIQFTLFTGALWRVEVFNLSGSSVFRSNWVTGKQLSWDLSAVANGVYLYVVTVQSADGQTITSKLQKLVVLR
ncbi:MAG: S8 family serine peptidase [Candidatus Caldarchaeum sp.]